MESPVSYFFDSRPSKRRKCLKPIIVNLINRLEYILAKDFDAVSPIKMLANTAKIPNSSTQLDKKVAKIETEASMPLQDNSARREEKDVRTERKTQYGIDCSDIVHFSHW